MQPFTTLTGVIAPLDRPNVDTDAIIPKQYLKSVERSGFGPNLFDDWRYLDPGEPGMDHTRRRVNPAFVLNQPPYDRAQLLLSRANFGCGSSREHAVWALADFGIRVVIASGFADIFFNNCVNNGVLPVVLSAAQVDRLFQAIAARPGVQVTVDLPAQTVAMPVVGELCFELDPYRKARLLQGLDDIGLTLQRAADIRAYEARRREQAPWLFAAGGDHR